MRPGFGFRPLGPPEPAERFCSNCNRTVTLNEGWTCPTPDCTGPGGKPLRVIYSTVRGECEGCGRPRTFMYRGNTVKPLHCVCEETEQQRQAAERRARAEEARVIREAEDRQNSRESRDCWEEMNRACKVSKQNLFTYCYTCTRFGGKFQTLLSRWERENPSNPELIEIPFEDGETA